MPTSPPENEPENLAEMSEAERRRHERQMARRRAKKQKRELNRIRREARGPASKTMMIWAAVLVGLLAVIGFGSYKFWNFYSINLHRKSFMDDYNVADLSALRRFSPDLLGDVEEAKRLAESAAESGARAGDVCAHYRKASKLLQEAVVEARTQKEQYEDVLGRYEALAQEARERKLNEYAPMLWEQIEARAQAGRDTSASSFTADLGIRKLREAITMLEKAGRSYEDLKAFDAAYSSYLGLEEQINEEELSRNVPSEFAEFKSSLTRAHQAEQLQQWPTATKAYARAVGIIRPVLERVSARRRDAQEAVDRLRTRIQQVAEAGLARKDPEAWEELKVGMAAMETALASANYDQVEQQIGPLLERVSASEARVNEVAIARRERLAGLEQAYATASEFEAFFQANFAAEWLELVQGYRGIRELAAGENNVALMAEIDRLEGMIAELLKRREALLADLAAAREKIKALQAEPMARHVALNFPDVAEDVFVAQRSAQRALEANNLAVALEHLRTVAAGLDDAVGRLKALREASRRLDGECRAAFRLYEKGMAAFRPQRMRQFDGLVQRARQFVEGHRYVMAGEVYAKVLELLPADRFVAEREGTVCDYTTGLMWAGDPAGPGANGGKPLSWYDARHWAYELSAAGFTDWRLPTEEELRDITAVPQAKRAQVLPGLQTGTYWSDVASTASTREALAVDMEAGRLKRLDKQEELPVRAVRAP